MDEPPTIDHNPYEKRLGNGIWWVIAIILTLLWIGTGAFFGFDWHQLALGGFSGMALASWAIEKTGNKTPEWMRPIDPPRGQRGQPPWSSGSRSPERGDRWPSPPSCRRQ